MSHTYEHEEVSFSYNADMSGYITITNNETGKRFEVPAEAILDFVAQHIVQEKISRLENCSTDEILFGDMP